ncbi:hypothetical protein [Arthrobacter sp. B3I4]|uniref:hypothetical protein n=1 Tax=Arthrobacter sp. B3I4 TaxID=3042267 RepID=UPI002786F236|nr:hypothetical protein [Arthrobacter sp. B3I4]MDQ0757295.1 hypothetical protein [Arthrobacter sp. B3I4]
MDSEADYQPPLQLEGQTSINDYLDPIPAITPVELREPTDDELDAFLTAQLE